jgi:glucose repression regulatory protein TUP1
LPFSVLADETANKTGDLYIRSVCYSPDGKFLATGAEDKQIRVSSSSVAIVGMNSPITQIWDIQKKKIRNIFTGHQQEIYSLDFSRDGRLIVSGSGDRTARIWDMQTSDQKVLTINEPETVDAGVTSVAISKDGRLVAAGSLDTIVRIWDVQSGQLIERLNGHRDSVYSVAFTPDGMGLVSGSLDKTLKHWDLSPLIRRSERERNTPLQQGGTTPSSQGKKEGGEKGSVCTQNFIGHKVRRHALLVISNFTNALQDYVLSVAVSHDGKWIVSGSKDRCVQFWDARSAQWQLMLQGHKNSGIGILDANPSQPLTISAVISIDLSPMNNLLATGSGDTQARICKHLSDGCHSNLNRTQGASTFQPKYSFDSRSDMITE